MHEKVCDDVGKDINVDVSSLTKKFAISEEDLKFTRRIFQKFDSDSDGKLSKWELIEAFIYLGLIAFTSGDIQKLIKTADINDDNEIDFSEFLKYVCEHQQKLKLVFQHLDSNSDGKIDSDEVQSGLSQLGIKISHREAESLLEKVRATGSEGEASIDWQQWRDYHLFHPTEDFEDIIRYWRHGSNLDVGDDLRVPDELSEGEKVGYMLFKTLVAGGVAGAISRTCTAPLDRLKVLLQVHSSSKNKLGFSTGLRQLYSDGGFFGLWRGNGMNVIKIAPESAIKFLTYERMKLLIKSPGQEITALERLIAGSTAGLIAQSAIYPMEVLKTKLVLRRTGEYSNLIDCAMKVYREGGVRAFYRGYVPNAIGIIPYAGIDLMVYETLKGKYLQREHNATDESSSCTGANSNPPGVFVLLTCGAVSSSCGQLASYPFALIRTKMQDTTASQKRQPSMRQLALHILRTEGPQGLYRGIVPNFLKVIPAVSISYVVYEKTKRALGL